MFVVLWSDFVTRVVICLDLLPRTPLVTRKFLLGVCDYLINYVGKYLRALNAKLFSNYSSLFAEIVRLDNFGMIGMDVPLLLEKANKIPYKIPCHVLELGFCMPNSNYLVNVSNYLWKCPDSFNYFVRLWWYNSFIVRNLKFYSNYHYQKVALDMRIFIFH